MRHNVPVDVYADSIEPGGLHLLKDIWPKRWNLTTQETLVDVLIYRNYEELNRNAQGAARGEIHLTYNQTILSTIAQAQHATVETNIPDKDTLTMNNQTVLIPLNYISESI